MLSYCFFPFEVYNSNISCQICKVKLDMLFASFITLIKNDFHETFLAWSNQLYQHLSIRFIYYVISFLQTRYTLIWCLLVHLWWRASVHPLFHLSPGGHQPLRLSRGNKAGSRDASTISRPSFNTVTEATWPIGPTIF